MSDDNKKTDRAPSIPRDLPMPPYHYQRDSRGSNGASPRPEGPLVGVGILRGANLAI